MHVCSVASILLVNAKVDSMGGVVEGGHGAIDITSPHKEAIDSFQAEFRQECYVRDIRQRELEFLEKGGDPLDYGLGNAASASVQSTSFVGQRPDHEVKCNFPYSSSPIGDSVKSTGEPSREPNTADNLSLFDGCRSNREQGDSASFSIPGKAYKKRNRSRPNRDGSKSTSNDPSSSLGNNGSSLTAQPKSRDVKGSESDGKHRNVFLNWKSNPTNVMEPELEIVRSAGSTNTKEMIPDVSADAALEASYAPKKFVDGKLEQGLPSAKKAPREMDSSTIDVIQAAEEMTSAGVEHHASETAMEVENQHTSLKMNGEKDKAMTCISQRKNQFSSGSVEQLNLSLSGLENRSRDNVIVSAASISTGLESERNCMDSVCNNPDYEREGVLPVSKTDIISSAPDIVKAGSSYGVPSTLIVASTSSGSELKVTNKIDEDSILKEAQIIQAKRKRIAELSVRTSSIEIRQRAHWTHVLEEMTWMANDFAQERIWKTAAAAQISCCAAFSCCLKKQEQDSSLQVMKVAHELARAVREFWLSVDLKCEETKEELVLQHQKNGVLAVQAYAVRFLKYNRNIIFLDHVEVPLTPDRISNYGNFDIPLDNHFPEEKLFYTVSPGAIQAYRKSIESHVTSERIGFSAPEELETSACDAATAFESEGPLYDDDEGDTSALNMDAFEILKSSRFTQLKRKSTHYPHGTRSYEIEPDFVPMNIAKNQFVSQLPSSVVVVKRPKSHPNVSVPTKRVRTASRRVLSPLSAEVSASGDTNSYQEDHQGTLRGGLLESTGDFEKQLPFDAAEVSTKPKKRKKSTHLNADYEENWHVNSTFGNDQFERDHLKKTSEGHHLKSNGNIGLLGQPMMKKPKIVRQSHDSSFDNFPPTGGSMPSPAATQMSNMSMPNKFIKILGGRDRSRNEKGLKSPYGQLGCGSPWSLVEDQALVVLVHDLGPNWEFVSDALSSTLRFKCIFRKAEECKDRHSALMDRTSGDGADSAEDSGSSQAYPSTLPGIPKGSARQLFQRLQGPNEENTLKSHFEKIIMMMQKQHCRKGQDPKPIQTPHNSHAIAFSQVCPNNLNGGPVLTPLDLCDANPSGPEMLPMGYQGPHPTGLAVANQANGNPVFPASSPNPSLQGSPNVMTGSNFASSPRRVNSLMRSGSLSAEEQQRLQMYNQIISGRNMPSSPTERIFRTLPGGNGVRVAGVNRSLPMIRPLQQGMSPPSMVNSGTVFSPSMSSAGMPSVLSPNGHNTMLPEMMMSSYAISHPKLPQQTHHHPHVQGPPANHSNAQEQAYAVRLAKEKQLQQRLMQ